MTWLLALPVILLVGGATALVARRHVALPGCAKSGADGASCLPSTLLW